MTPDEIRALPISANSTLASIETLLREMVAQLAQVNIHLEDMFDADGEGIAVKVDAKYNDKGDGLRVVLVKGDDDDE